MTEAVRRPVVLMVCTRDIPAQPEAGRERTMAFIRQALQAQGQVAFFRLHSLLEQRSLRRLVGAAGGWLMGWLRGRPLPLQALLFLDRADEQRLAAEIQRLQPDAVYFDGVRSGLMAEAVRRRWPGLRLVCDFDDLMSHRMKLLADLRQPISMGYLRKLVPAWFERHVLQGLVGRAVQRHEQWALAAAEHRIQRVSNAVVLVSSVDAAVLRAAHPGLPVEVIPPVMTQAAASALPPQPRVERFVFIGADSLLQNRQTIEFLLQLWQRHVPATPLHLYGKMGQAHPSVAGVHFHGFVADVADVYQPGSVLLTPSFLPGGVKTKVLEAMGHGTVPLGTDITFAGIEADMAPMTVSHDGWAALLADPVAWLQPRWPAVAQALQQAALAHAPERIGERWRRQIWPDACA